MSYPPTHFEPSGSIPEIPMKTIHAWAGLAAAIAAVSVSALPSGQPVAEDLGTLPNVPVIDFANTPASSLADLTGNAVLIEFFAHW